MSGSGWSSPVALKLVPTLAPDSFRDMAPGWTGLPMGDRHPGAFGFQRKYHRHEGVDIYCPSGTPVTAVEPGRVTAVIRFTGPLASPPSPWWADTWAVMVDGPSGTVLYGEIQPQNGLSPGVPIERGQRIGRIERVLTADKGRPMDMLHLELYDAGTVAPAEWEPGSPCPAGLRDPTAMLADAASRSWDRPGSPAFLKAGAALIPLSAVERIGLDDVERDRVVIVHSGGRVSVACGFDAVEAVMLTRASALEGRRMKWRKGAWALHNLFAHPAMQLMAWAGYGRLGVRLHDATTPAPRG